jgi:hypothetical protein
MKEIEQKQNIEIVEQKNQYQEIFLGSMVKRAGHTIFEYNTKELNPAEHNYSFEKGKLKDKIIVKGDCIYIQALNKKNALKKILKNNM